MTGAETFKDKPRSASKSIALAIDQRCQNRYTFAGNRERSGSQPAFLKVCFSETRLMGVPKARLGIAREDMLIGELHISGTSHTLQ